MQDREGRVRQLRLVIEVEDYDEAVRFYRDGLGLEEELSLDGTNGARVTILAAGRATLELANPAQKAMIDELEVGRQVAPRYRLAFEIDDGRTVTADLIAAGAELIAPPTKTPWRSLNSRLTAPDGTQLTIFEELDGRTR
jgi:catechol 2,3-dioxygenase-like lactoylglutathione lyase family enzyme